MKACEYKVGDVWKILAHDHYRFPFGTEVTVTHVDDDGDAVCHGISVALDRIDLEQVELVSRLGDLE